MVLDGSISQMMATFIKTVTMDLIKKFGTYMTNYVNLIQDYVTIISMITNCDTSIISIYK